MITQKDLIEKATLLSKHDMDMATIFDTKSNIQNLFKEFEVGLSNKVMFRPPEQVKDTKIPSSIRYMGINFLFFETDAV